MGLTHLDHAGHCSSLADGITRLAGFLGVPYDVDLGHLTLKLLRQMVNRRYPQGQNHAIGGYALLLTIPDDHHPLIGDCC